MCKYCKRLKEINVLNKSVYENLIDAWKRRDVEARKLIMDLLKDSYAKDPHSYSHAFLMVKVERFLSCNWIGK